MNVLLYGSIRSIIFSEIFEQFLGFLVLQNFFFMEKYFFTIYNKMVGIFNLDPKSG